MNTSNDFRNQLIILYMKNFTVGLWTTQGDHSDRWKRVLNDLKRRITALHLTVIRQPVLRAVFPSYFRRITGWRKTVTKYAGFRHFLGPEKATVLNIKASLLLGCLYEKKRRNFDLHSNIEDFFLIAERHCNICSMIFYKKMI
jgi:hypothetical protein